MKKQKPSARPFKDFLRLASTDEFLCRAGTLMMRRSLRVALWTVGITSSGYLSNLFGLPGFTALQAIFLPLFVGGGMFGLGAGMRYIPTTISRRLTVVAEANDLNLMEDYRKSQVVEHLNVLWDKVFWYESAIRYSEQERRAEREQLIADGRRIAEVLRGCGADVLERLKMTEERGIEDAVTAVMTERALSDDMEKSREGFLISARYAVRHAMPQSSQADGIGFNLGFYEDMCDGAYFDASDVKLSQQYCGSTMLAGIKGEIGLGKMHVLKQIPRAVSQKFWFYLVTRKIATGVGRAVKILNEKYKTDAFNVQALLWPGEEDAGWLDDLPGARDEVVKMRSEVVISALGEDYDNAVEVLDRMLLPCMEFATDLRMRYDPEYCDGSLDYTAEDTGDVITNNLVGDLETRGCSRRDIDKAQAYCEKVKAGMGSLMEFLENPRREWVLEDKVALRAVKVAFHTNRGGIKTMFERGDPTAHCSDIDAVISEVTACKDTYTKRLVGLRLHHQLAMINVDGYRNLARKLAYEQ